MAFVDQSTPKQSFHPGSQHVVFPITADPFAGGGPPSTLELIGQYLLGGAPQLLEVKYGEANSHYDAGTEMPESPVGGTDKDRWDSYEQTPLADPILRFTTGFVAESVVFEGAAEGLTMLRGGLVEARSLNLTERAGELRDQLVRQWSHK